MGKGGGCVPSKKKAVPVVDDPPRNRVGATEDSPIELNEEARDGDASTAATAIQETAPQPPVAAARLKIFIVFYSMYGHVEGLARRMKKGVDGVDGVEGVLYRVPETLPIQVLEQMKAPPKDDGIPEITAAELAAE